MKRNWRSSASAASSCRLTPWTSMVHFPIVAVFLDQARLDIITRGHVEQRLARQQRSKAGNRLADQQGFLMPVIAQESGGTDVAEQSQGIFHGDIIERNAEGYAAENAEAVSLQRLVCMPTASNACDRRT